MLKVMKKEQPDTDIRWNFPFLEKLQPTTQTPLKYIWVWFLTRVIYLGPLEKEIAALEAGPQEIQVTQPYSFNNNSVILQPLTRAHVYHSKLVWMRKRGNIVEDQEYLGKFPDDFNSNFIVYVWPNAQANLPPLCCSF